MAIHHLLLLIPLALPGLVACAAFPPLRRDLTAGETLFAILLISLLLAGWLALLLAELGVFSYPLLCIIGLAVALGMALARRRHLASPLNGLRFTRWGLTLLAVLAAAAWLYFRPYEYVLGGRDHGVYVNTGVTIARSGAIPVSDPLLAGLPIDQRSALLDDRPLLRAGGAIDRTWLAGATAPGYYLFHLDSSQVVPHGFHLYPAWMAVLSAVGGVEFSLCLTPVLAWLGLLAVALTARRAFGGGSALLAAALITVNLAHLWYARTPSAEVLVYFLFWSGAWAWVRAGQTGDPVFALLGGVAWGQIHLAKIEYIALPIVLFTWLTWAWWTGRFRTCHAVGLLAYGLMALHALLHGLIVATSYFFNTIVEFAPVAFAAMLSQAAARANSPVELIGQLVALNATAILAAVFVLILAVFVLRRIKGRGAEVWARLASSQWTAWGLAAGLMALGVYAFFSVPTPVPISGVSELMELSWYTGPLAIGLGVAGFARHIGRMDASRGMLLWTVLGAGAVFLVTGSLTYPDHFWAVRRFIPIALPGLILLASDAVVSLLPRHISAWRRVLVPAVLAGSLAWSAVEASRPLAGFSENRGVLDRVRQLNETFEQGAVLLFDRDAPGAQVGTPLQMIYGRSAAHLDDLLGPQVMQSIISSWLDQGHAIFYLSSAPHPVSIPGYSLDYLRTEVVAFPAAEHGLVFRPTRVGEVADTFDVYQVLPQQAVQDRVMTLDIGSETSAADMTGVYADPLLPGLTSAQWTTAQPSFSFTFKGRPRRLLLRMGGVPSVVSDREIEVLVNGTRLDRVVLRPDSMNVYSIRFPEDASPVTDLVVDLRVPTWNPQTIGLAPDARDLGVYLDWVKLVAKVP